MCNKNLNESLLFQFNWFSWIRFFTQPFHELSCTFAYLLCHLKIRGVKRLTCSRVTCSRTQYSNTQHDQRQTLVLLLCMLNNVLCNSGAFTNRHCICVHLSCVLENGDVSECYTFNIDWWRVANYCLHWNFDINIFKAIHVFRYYFNYVMSVKKILISNTTTKFVR